jgi:hypothetical protein
VGGVRLQEQAARTGVAVDRGRKDTRWGAAAVELVDGGRCSRGEGDRGVVEVEGRLAARDGSDAAQERVVSKRDLGQVVNSSRQKNNNHCHNRKTRRDSLVAICVY